MGVQRSFLLSPPERIHGVGQTRAAALADEGIHTIAEMFRAGPRKVHTLCTNVGGREVGEWFCAAMLLRLKGVDPSLARAFVEAGVRSVRKLREADLADLEEIVQRAHSSGRLPKAPTVYELSALQRAGWELADLGMLAGCLLRSDGVPIVDALVDIGEQEMRTDDRGWYAFDKVPVGQLRMRIEVDGRPLPLESMRRTVTAGKLLGPLIQRLSPLSAAGFNLPITREFDGHLIANMRGTRVQLTWLPLDQFPDGTFFQVRHLGKDGSTRLLSYYKDRIGSVVYIRRARVPIVDLPAGTKVNEILRYTAGRLEVTGLAPKDVAELKRQKWQASTHRVSRRLVRFVGKQMGGSHV